MKFLNRLMDYIDDSAFELPITIGCTILMLAGLMGAITLVVDLYIFIIRPLLISWAENL